jgi:hypothetical protein
MSNDLKRFLADLAERASRTFLQAYFAAWVAFGMDFDHLFTRNNLEAGVVGLAASVAMSLGAKRTGANDSASLLPANVDPPQDDGAVDIVTALVVVFLIVVIARIFGLI